MVGREVAPLSRTSVLRALARDLARALSAGFEFIRRIPRPEHY